MFKTFANIFRVPELRNKVLFTLFLLAIYRIGFHVPIPGVDQNAFTEMTKNQQESDTVGRITAYLSIFSGGTLSQSTIFGLGVMPYISASIIFQLLATVVPSLEKLQKEGETGRRKIQEWTRYTTVPLCLIQGVIWIKFMYSPGAVKSLVQSQFHEGLGQVTFWFMALACLTAGCLFLMWLGEQIDEYGLGNGISLLILAGIVARMPYALVLLGQKTDFSVNPAEGMLGIPQILFLAFSFVFIIAGSILVTQAQRRIPVQQAKHTKGRRVYGGSRQYLPLRVNHGGVMPIIFAQSLMLFPGFIFDKLNDLVNSGRNPEGVFGQIIFALKTELGRGHFIYILTEVVMIYFFSYFWTTVQFQPKEMANQLRDYGSFIPGLRPGKRTADYLEKVMMRMTYVGGAFLCIIAVIPTAITTWMNVDYNIAAFLGGTGLLIVVSVALDMVQRIEANLLMRNYGGFLSGPGGKGRRIKGRQY